VKQENAIAIDRNCKSVVVTASKQCNL